MVHNLFVAFSANNAAMIEAIAALGEWHEFQPGLVFLRSQAGYDETFQQLRQVQGTDDKLLVIDSGSRVMLKWDEHADESAVLAEIFCAHEE